jgi:hypothetical protein
MADNRFGLAPSIGDRDDADEAQQAREAAAYRLRAPNSIAVKAGRMLGKAAAPLEMPAAPPPQAEEDQYDQS